MRPRRRAGASVLLALLCDLAETAAPDACPVGESCAGGPADRRARWDSAEPADDPKAIKVARSPSGMITATNRGTAILDGAAAEFVRLVEVLRDPARKLRLEARLASTAVTYVDPYQGRFVDLSALPEEVTAVARSVHSRSTNYISDKQQFGREARRASVEGSVVPRTFETAAEAAAALSEGGGLAFVKSCCGTSGQDVMPIHVEDLPDLELPKEHIVQEGVSELALWRGRKFVIRAYLVAHGGALHVSRHAFVVSHGAVYDAGSASYEIHVKHAGYMDKDSKIKIFPLSRLEGSDVDGPALFNAIVDAVGRAGAMFEAIVEQTRLDPMRYALLGLDVIPKTDGTVRFIECNSWPNIVHTQEVNEEVNVKTLVSLLRALLDAPGPRAGTEGAEGRGEEALDAVEYSLIKVWEPPAPE